MKPLGPKQAGGRFTAVYTKAAQVDFSGTMRGGRSVRFEAKQTDSDRFERKRLTDEQMDDLRGHEKLGALCFVILCFGFDHFYRVPWRIWDDMKATFGRQYVTEADLPEYRIPYTAGVIKILSGIIKPEAGELVYVPDICVVCGEYAGEGSHLCPRCKKKVKDEGLL
jgi:recombination protein U